MINKDNLLKKKNISPNKYNSDILYKMIKNDKVPYVSLSKETILNLILLEENRSKMSKFQNHNNHSNSNNTSCDKKLVNDSLLRLSKKYIF